VLLVVASSVDEVARAFAARWARAGARLLTPLDLTRRGWVQGDGVRPALVAGGEPVDERDVRGVVCRLQAVLPHELPHVAEQDRAYLAGELHAFLAWWLRQLPCAVVNRPTPYCLTGPNWRAPQWLHAAAAAGLPVAETTVAVRDCAARAEAADARPAPGMTLQVLDGRPLGAAPPALAAGVARLAASAGVRWLSASFTAGSRPRFVAAETVPDLAMAERELLAGFGIADEVAA